ncbi:hypothetical protein FB567DRAFT_611516 [Paraphoma chrysanthemicola]|uniref:Secreted protein n=1 Tax=Paraphoma chrysanthemicola TaxID=798071 RepID=A0A8K0QWT2_9PLEO|nr:hypothetical protein FB567DRAFT_611516 [Paraphoma chrysanthemicola]
MNLLTFLLITTLYFASIVYSTPLGSNNTLTANTTTAAAYDPSREYHDYSTVQIWMGKNKAAVGDTVGPALYDIVWRMLEQHCPVGPNKCNLNSKPGLCFMTNTLGKYPYPVERTHTCINKIAGEYDTEQIRKLLIGAVAGTLEAMTNQPFDDVSGMRTNCYDVGGKKGCNVRDTVRVNMPMRNSELTYMHVGLVNGWTTYGVWDCCTNGKLGKVDKAIDGLGGEIGSVFGQKFTKDSRCIIEGWRAC